MIQIKFKDLENDVIHGGIMLDNGDVVCGCCGCLIPADEMTPEQGNKIIEKYTTWISLDNEIISE